MNRPAEKRSDKNLQKPTKKTNCHFINIFNLCLFLLSFHNSFHVLPERWTVTWNEGQKSLSFHLSFHVLPEKWKVTWNQSSFFKQLKHQHTKRESAPRRKPAPIKRYGTGRITDYLTPKSSSP